MTLEYRIGDVRERLAEIPDGSIDLIVTSPPFLALRSYLPSDHPDKHREIGSEATPADFLDTLLGLSAEWGRVLAPHGSLCVELGDTYSGSGGAGGDYSPGGLREGQDKFEGSAYTARQDTKYPKVQDERVSGGGITNLHGKKQGGGNGWPLAKSLTGIPTLYPWSLAYGRNLLRSGLTPEQMLRFIDVLIADGVPPADALEMGRDWLRQARQHGLDEGPTFPPWRIRNLIVWARPNPPVGALGDKFRPATSYITVACRSAKRYFDLDAVRVPGPSMDRDGEKAGYATKSGQDGVRGFARDCPTIVNHPAGAPPLDWHADHHPEDGDWLWKLSTQPYAGSHYATFPMALPKRLIEAMCPLRVCRVCGRPSERITGEAEYVRTDSDVVPARLGLLDGERVAPGVNQHTMSNGANTSVVRNAPTLGWSSCGCLCVDCFECHREPCPHKWRTGIVLDPFAGSGTTLEAAQAVGRHAIGIDLNARNADLARDRVGMFLEVVA